jgi:hypothetical protein
VTESGAESEILGTVQSVNALVTGQSASNTGDSSAPPGASPAAQATGLAVQSVAQSAAMIVQDAGNLFRNLSTIEATAIGVATAKWIGDPDNVAYLLIIEESQRVIQNAAAIIEAAGKSASTVLQAFSAGGGT